MVFAILLIGLLERTVLSNRSWHHICVRFILTDRTGATWFCLRHRPYAVAAIAFHSLPNSGSRKVLHYTVLLKHVVTELPRSLSERPALRQKG